MSQSDSSIVSSGPPSSRDLAAAILRRILLAGAIAAEAWETLSPEDRATLTSSPDLPTLADRLLARRLVTPFQAGRIRAGAVAGLVLGNYRLLEKIGTGGMGAVFRGEHTKLRNPVAVKTLLADGPRTGRAVDRFFQEVRAVASLRHPNIVAAIDAGEEPHAGPDGETIPYLVMEFVTGRDLDDLVTREGPLGIARACQLGSQIADALTEAHRHGLVHRDIKPSNILVTPDGQAKLLDFGVARLPTAGDRLTADGARIGTAAYMPPEQAIDPRDADARADVFGLAATLFFALTAHDPFSPPAFSAGAAQPPVLTDFRPDAPPALADALGRMMAFDRDSRTATAAAAVRELAPFLGWTPAGRSDSTAPASGVHRLFQPAQGASGRAPHRILIVDDEEAVRRICRLALVTERIDCDEVANGSDAVLRAGNSPYDLILLDVDLPGCNGVQVLHQIRSAPRIPHLKVIMMSGRSSGDDLSRALMAGADDYLTKPFSVIQLRARVQAALRLKDAQDRSDTLARQLAGANADLERALGARDVELVHARSAMVLALAKLVGQRSTETGGHLIRLQRYCRVLGEAAAATPAFAGRLDPDVVQAIESAAPLHDIGKVAVPDHILNKPGPLTSDERMLMQSHTTIGAETLAEVASRYPFATAFFATAIELTRHHHERWDGEGYPDRLAGEAIPLSARLLAVADVYDALRSRRVYKPTISHPAAVDQMLTRSPGHFDPALLEVFGHIAPQFDRVYRETVD